MSGGKNLIIRVIPIGNKSVFFWATTLHSYHGDHVASQKQMKQLSRFIRSLAGKKSVHKYYSDHMLAKGKTLKV